MYCHTVKPLLFASNCELFSNTGSNMILIGRKCFRNCLIVTILFGTKCLRFIIVEIKMNNANFSEILKYFSLHTSFYLTSIS